MHLHYLHVRVDVVHAGEQQGVYQDGQDVVHALKHHLAAMVSSAALLNGLVIRVQALELLLGSDVVVYSLEDSDGLPVGDDAAGYH